MRYTFYETAILFFAWSFLAWLAETAVATIKEKDFRNRGFASGPFCFIYGFTGVLFLIFLQELKEDIVFLFLGSVAVATAVEWFTGKLLGQDVLRAKLGELIYHCEGVANYTITTPGADVPVDDDVLPVLGTLKVEAKT